MLTYLQFVTTWARARFVASDRGAAMVEYALLVALIAVVCIVAITTLGSEAKEGFESTGSTISEVYAP